MKILVIRFSSLGDCVLLASLLTHLKASGASEVTIVTKSLYVPLFSAVPGVDRVIGLGDKGALGGLLQIAAEHRSNGNTIIDAHNNLRSWILSERLGGARTRVKKYHRARLGLLLFKRHVRIPSVKARYEALGLSLGFPPMKDAHGRLDLPGSAEARASEWLAPFDGEFVTVAPGSRWPMKRWGADRYLELCRRLTARYGYRVILLGDRGDQAMCASIESTLGRNVLNLAGESSILEAAALIKRSAAFIGNDSGLMHLAEIVGVPVVVLFGPTVESFGYYPSLPESKVLERDLRCRPCSKNGARPCPKASQECLTRIPVDAVEKAFMDLLKREGPRRYVIP